MAKIIVSFFVKNTTAQKLPVFYDAFVSALKRRGHSVVVLSGGIWRNGNQSAILPCDDILIENITKFNPDLCIVFNNIVDLAGIVECPILVYEADTILYYSNLDRIKENPGRYLFCNNDDTTLELVNKYGVSPQQICPAYPFSGVVAEKRKITDNVVFIASKFTQKSESVLNWFLAEKPTDKERFEFKKCMRYLIKNPFTTRAQMIKKGIMVSDRVKRFFASKDFVGELSDEKRIKVLSAIVDLGLKIYGTPNWGTDYFYQSDINLAYSSQEVLSVKENADVYNSAKIGISIGHLQAVNTFPWRVLDIMSSNACLVSDYHKCFDEFFIKDLFPVYNDAYEAREICKRLLNDEEERVRFVEKCQQYVRNNFTFERVADSISSLTGVKI